MFLSSTTFCSCCTYIQNLLILCNNIHIVLIFISSKTTSLDNKRPRSQVQILTQYFQATAQNISDLLQTLLCLEANLVSFKIAIRKLGALYL